MKIESAINILEAFEKALYILESWSQEDEAYVWFRGVKSKRYPLIPGAYRHKGYNEFEPILDLCQSGVKFHEKADFDTWSTYYFAQHHGIPTRLLDWTESFTAALFFAIDGANSNETPCVWLLQPHLLNEFTINWDVTISPEINGACNIWLPRGVLKPEILEVEKEEIFTDGSKVKYDNSWPIAIYPRQDNERLYAQRGQFTVHGREKEPLEEIILKNCSEPNSVIARIDFVGADVKRMKEQLQILGVRRSSVYPDIQNYIQDLKEEYGW